MLSVHGEASRLRGPTHGLVKVGQETARAKITRRSVSVDLP